MIWNRNVYILLYLRYTNKNINECEKMVQNLKILNNYETEKSEIKVFECDFRDYETFISDYRKFTYRYENKCIIWFEVYDSYIIVDEL
jgi:hypothetical protein